MKTWKKYFQYCAAVLLTAAVFISCSLQPTFSVSGIESDITVENTTDYIKLSPGSASVQQAGVIFYPGGLVEPEAYIKMLAPVAEAGYEVFIIPMPLDLAVFAPNRAEKIIGAVQKSSWIIAGHSLGGVMAAQFAYKNSTDVQGLVLLAAYPADGSPLTEKTLPVLSIYGSEDGLCTPSDIANTKDLLPGQTEFFRIDGGNHAQFGSYGKQNGDGEALITEAEQQRLTSDRIIAFLNLHF